MDKLKIKISKNKPNNGVVMKPNKHECESQMYNIFLLLRLKVSSMFYLKCHQC